ncbi:MAG: hypothetical protein EXS18_06395 [Verrucomicrobiae bacterium]|nr:hypothetical protein [Verrucomicrobiae bacterium]
METQGVALGWLVLPRWGTEQTTDCFRITVKLMLDFLGELAEFVSRIWSADSHIRDRSRLGESGMDRQSRRFVAWSCGGIIVLIVLAGIAWWWFAGDN